MTKAAGNHDSSSAPHPNVSAETGNAPYGTVPRRSNGPLLFWTFMYVAWVGILLTMAWMRFHH